MIQMQMLGIAVVVCGTLSIVKGITSYINKEYGKATFWMVVGLYLMK